uniref:Retropepsins domain-containing protein n=1 Tax=Trichuris muris TaxID=70415 RepID=A0A5S6Q0Q8_TRIMR
MQSSCSTATGKRSRGGGLSASLLPTQSSIEALPTVQMEVDGRQRNVLVDTGCSKCVAYVACCKNWKKRRVSMITVDGKELRCEGKGIVHLQPPGCGSGQVSVEVIVVSTKPLGFDLILGMNAILALGGVTVSKRGQVSFSGDAAAVSAACISPPHQARRARLHGDLRSHDAGVDGCLEVD